MNRIHLLPNVFTALGLICGLFVIFKLNMTGVGAVDHNVLKTAAAFLLLASLFDLLDGAVARAMNVESEFGGLFDSLADAVTFGVAPSVIILKSVSADPGSFSSFVLTTAALVYSMCGILRLVRFNVHANERNHDDLDLMAKYFFIGLPIPAAAAAAVSLDFVLISPEVIHWIALSDMTIALFLSFALLILGYFMISRWKFPSLKGFQTRIYSFKALFTIILLSSVIFYGLVHHFALVFFAISWGYFLFSILFVLTRYIMSKISR